MSTAFAKDEKLFLNEEEELVMRPVLPWNIPDAGCRAQSHNIPKIQKKPNPSPMGSLAHVLQNLCTDCIGRHPRRQRHKQKYVRHEHTDLRTRISAITIFYKQSKSFRLVLQSCEKPDKKRVNPHPPATAPSLMNLSEDLAELRLHHLDGLGTSTQATHIHGTSSVYFDEAR